MNDYLLFLEEIGLTPEQMQAVMDKGIPFISSQTPGVEYKPSSIHGTGAFSLREFGLGEVVDAGMINGEWTELGRFGNHSSIPNMRAEKNSSGFHFVADRAIREKEELTVNYRSVKTALTKEGP